MKKFYLFTFLALLLVYSSYSQNIGINATGAAPDSSAALDITSTTTGLLAPRMTTAQMNAITRPSKGLMVYNTTANAFYVNTGTTTTSTWVKIITTTNGRDNYVIVKSVSDFPSPASGVITLTSGTCYNINGTITLTDKIDLNGCTMNGSDPTNDKLIYTPTSGELFSGANGGVIKSLTLTASGVGGKLFNINAANANKNFIMQNCMITGCDNIGTIRGFGGNTYLENNMFSGNTNGIIFYDDNNIILNTSMWDNTNHNTYEKYTGTFSNIQVVGGTRATTSGYSGVGMDISGITSLSTASLKSTMFSGTGTKVSGTFSSAWEVNTYGISEQSDDNASGSIYMSTSTATVIATVNTPLKGAGTTTSSSLFRFTMPSNNRLTYTGIKTRTFTIIASLSTLTEANGKNVSVYFYKNGSVLTDSKQTYKQVNANDGTPVMISSMVTLATNDYIEVWVENNSDNKNITLDKMNLAIR